MRRIREDADMGIGMSGVRNSGVSKIVIKNRDGSAAATMTYRKPTLVKPKRLSYNFKRISTQIMQAKTSGNARQVVARARGEAVLLRRKLRNGDYSTSETRNAMIHAEKMVRIAKKRLKHLQEEEEIKKKGKAYGEEPEEETDEYGLEDMDISDVMEMSGEQLRQLMQELQEALEEMESEDGMEELSQAFQGEMSPEDLELLKKKHRGEEMRDIIEADMKYLKALFDKLVKERQEVASGVKLELSGTEIPVMVTDMPEADIPAATEGGNIDVMV